jgi:hypothetical protein
VDAEETFDPPDIHTEWDYELGRYVAWECSESHGLSCRREWHQSAEEREAL